MGLAAQAGDKGEAVTACGCWCRMCPSPCALANLHPLACRPPATRSTYTIPQVGTSHIWKVRKRAPGKSQRIYAITSLRMWGWLLRRWLLLFSWVSTEQVTGLAHHWEGLWCSGAAFWKSLKSDLHFLSQNQSGPEECTEQQMQPAVLMSLSFAWLRLVVPPSIWTWVTELIWEVSVPALYSLKLPLMDVAALNQSCSVRLLGGNSYQMKEMWKWGLVLGWMCAVVLKSEEQHLFCHYMEEEENTFSSY